MSPIFSKLKESFMAKLRDHSVQDYLSTRYISDIRLNEESSVLSFTTSGVYKEFKEDERKEVVIQFVKDGKQKVCRDESR